MESSNSKGLYYFLHVYFYTSIFIWGINIHSRPFAPQKNNKLKKKITRLGAADNTSSLAGAFTSNPALLSMLQGKLGTLVGRPSGYIDSLPTAVKRRLNGLKYLQSKHADLENKFQEEVLALEKKYLLLYQPLYDQRTKIITGTYEPTEEEVAAGEKVDDEEEDDDDEDEEDKDNEEEEKDTNDDKDIKGIPEFWLTLLKNHPQITETITDEDEDALKHLIDVRMSYMDQPGFKLEFEFSENDYFTNKVLSKTYFYQDHAYGGDFVYDHAEGCSIDWKDGKDLTVTVETKKQRHKGTNKTRVVKRTIPSNSFFYFFSPPAIPDAEEEIDEEEAEGLDAKLEADYEMGEEFKDKIIPHAVDYFTGKALQYEDYDDEEDFDVSISITFFFLFILIDFNRTNTMMMRMRMRTMTMRMMMTKTMMMMTLL